METTIPQSYDFIRWHFSHIQVRRPGNPHTSVMGAYPPYDSTSGNLYTAWQRLQIDSEVGLRG